MNVECLVAEHRPDNARHRQAVRTLWTTQVSSTEMVLQGQPRYEQFRVTIDWPFSAQQPSAEVRVISKTDNTFTVQFLHGLPKGFPND